MLGQRPYLKLDLVHAALLFTLILFFSIHLAVPVSHAYDGLAAIKAAPGCKVITGLSFHPNNQGMVDIIENPENPKKSIMKVKLVGYFNHPFWSILQELPATQSPEPKLLLSSQAAQTQSGFSLTINLASKGTELKLLAVGPKGGVERCTYLITPLWESGLKATWDLLAGDRPPKHFSLGLGVTSNTYTETGLTPYSQWALTPKLSYQTRLGSQTTRWTLGLNVFVTGLILTSNRSDVSPRFLGANIRFGYRLFRLGKGLTFSLSVGPYFTMMLGTSGQFGYQPILYGQVYPAARYQISLRYALNAYVKYVPLSFTALSTDRELASGVNFESHYFPNFPMTLGLDYSHLAFAPLAGARISSKSLGISLGILL